MMMGDGNFSPSPSPSKRVRLSQYSLPTSILPSATSHAARDLLSGAIGGMELRTYRYPLFVIPFPADSVVDPDQVYLLKNRLLIGLLQAETEIDVLHKNDIVNGQIKPQSPRSEIFLTLLISLYHR
jgi:hypothetical protein